MQFCNSAIEEAKVLHYRLTPEECGVSEAMFFSTLRRTGGRPVARGYRMPYLEDVVAASLGEHDSYISQSSFFSYQRKAVNFKQTRAAWVDLDLYTINKRVEPLVVGQILRHGEKLGIPAPSAIIFSGRGVNLKWYFNRPVTQSQLIVWQALQATLTAAYACFAADFNSRDISRVFRLIGTLNSKSGETVQSIDGTGLLYDFGTLCQAAESLRTDLLSSGAEKTERRIAKLAGASADHIQRFGSYERGSPEALQLYKELNEPIMLHKQSERSLNWARFCDMTVLYTARGGIPVGERDTALLWMLNTLGHAGVVRADNFAKEVQGLLSAFPVNDGFDPLADGSMGSLLMRLKERADQKKRVWRGRKVDPLYKPSNEYLIKTLKISTDEMLGLKTIISAQEKTRRRQAKDEIRWVGRGERRVLREGYKLEIQKAYDAAKIIACRAMNTPPTATQILKEINISALAMALAVDRNIVRRNIVRLASQDAISTPSTPRLEGAQLDDTMVPATPTHTEVASVDLPNATTNKIVMPHCVPEAVPAATALNLMGLTGIAKQEALKAKEAAELLKIRRRIYGLQEVWANKKLLELCPTNSAQGVGK